MRNYTVRVYMRLAQIYRSLKVYMYVNKRDRISYPSYSIQAIFFGRKPPSLLVPVIKARGVTKVVKQS